MQYLGRPYLIESTDSMIIIHVKQTVMYASDEEYEHTGNILYTAMPVIHRHSYNNIVI